jgi:hypothetical protein
MATLNESACSQMRTKGVLQEFARLPKISITNASSRNKYLVSMNYWPQTLAFIKMREYFTQQLYIYPGR